MRKKRVMLATQYEPNDTTSFLRAWGPFSLMRDEVEIVRKPKSDRADWFRDWHYWTDVDICFLHRAADPSFTHLAHYAKLHGVPVWVDHDDDLLKITNDNPVFNFFSNNKDAIEESYQYADILTCSGKVMHEELKTKYKREDAILITTGLDDRLVKFKKPYQSNNKVAWRGSKSHLTDLLYFQPAILECMDKYPELEWSFYGINPFFLNWYGKRNIKWVDSLNLYPYIHAITHYNASIQIVPLIDTPFNHVKSNLAWLDGTLAGSDIVGPDFEEWQKTSTFKYKSNNNEDFVRLFQNAMVRNEFGLTSSFHNEISWKYIQENLLQSKLNLKRLEILKNL